MTGVVKPVGNVTPGGNVRGVPGGPAVEPDGTVGNPVGRVTKCC